MMVPGLITALACAWIPDDVAGLESEHSADSHGDSPADSPRESPVDTGPFDRDNDGTVDAEDCAPDDPAIHPGAEEIWYEYVDQDCSGGSDHDQDGDGVDAGEDCSDHDAETLLCPRTCAGLPLLAESGWYAIDPTRSGSPVQVWCEMDARAAVGRWCWNAATTTLVA